MESIEGMTHQSKFFVQPQHSVQALGLGAAAVLATPVRIAFMASRCKGS